MTKPLNFSVGKFLRRYTWGILTFCALLTVTGCQEFFAEKPIELESQNIIRQVSEIHPTPETMLRLPDIYRAPARIIEGKVGEVPDAKLFYFTKHHTPNEIAKLINEQFLKRFADSKGKAYPVPDYSVSVNAGANQVIVRCPSVEDAEGVREFLEAVDVPPIQVKIDCIISEVYADHTMDWETTVDIQNLFGSNLRLGGKETKDGMLPAFPGAALRDIARSSFGLKAGFVHESANDGQKFTTLLDLLESRGYLKILMRPTLEVVNGKTATIVTNEKVPIDVITKVLANGEVFTKETKYEDVADSLKITPTVYADGYIGIKTKAIIGSKSTPEGVKQVPIVTKREIDIEENRIRPGESLVIGGITKTEKKAVVRGVPFFKDLPLIGVLFSSKDQEERGKEVLFILTPTISTGGISHERKIGELRDKHEMLKPETGLMDAFTDPLGRRIYTDLVEKEATRAETDRIRANIERSHAERKAEWLEYELKSAGRKTETDRSEMNKVRGEKRQIEEEIEQLKRDAEKIRRQAEAAQTKAESAEKKAVEAQKEASQTKSDYEAKIAAWIKEREESKSSGNSN